MGVFRSRQQKNLPNGFLFDLLTSTIERWLRCFHVCFVFNVIFAELP
jgi:hypothetical protein